MNQKPRATEKEIQNSILDWLAIHKIFAWQNDTVGIYDPGSKRFRYNPRKMKGVADILGIFEGLPIAIEVKTSIGRLTPHQKVFGDNFTKAGGHYIVARSIEDVSKYFRYLTENEL